MDKIWHSPEEGDSKGCIRNIHEDLAALRRENFRLRLLLYNYEQIYRQPRNCDDQESRAYTAECENVVLRKLVDARQQSLNKASEIIGSLKEENNHLKVLVDEMKSKNEEAEIDWRSKYDNLCSELQACHKEIQSRDMNLLVKDAELSRQRNEFESHISELQRQLDMSESLNHQYQQEIQLFRTEADNLRCTLENLNEEQPCLLDADAAIDQIQSADIHKSCKVC
ncbi:unnamed protein product [Trichobilharzia regenti]|nr:unnamed protein product [Trichobilharzia regenti]